MLRSNNVKLKKLKKLASADVSQPFRKAVVVVENKLKYLEQKKRRIEAYQEAGKNGKTLTGFQQSAIAKLSQVNRVLEDVRDVHEQFCNIAEKVTQAQEQNVDERSDRMQQDLSKIRDVLMIQYVLQNMRQDNVREDFLTGRNGAICLTESDLECLDEFYVEISLMNGIEDDVPPFEDQLQQSAEHLLDLVNGKVKEINGTTYAKLRELIVAIQSCGYFDYIVEENSVQMPIVKEEPELIVEEFTVVHNDDYTMQDQAALQRGASASCASVGVEELSEESKHTSENLFTCSVCQEEFPVKYRLKKHMRTHKKLAYCSICNSSFTWKYELSAHMRLHAGEKPLSCETCNATFSRIDSLKRHMFVHHDDDKPFSCSVCKAKFSLHRSLKSHMQKHCDETSFHCLLCSAAFTRNDDLEAHMLGHVEEEKFSCTVCSLEFSEKAHLDKHMLSHTNTNTTFSCPVCRLRFPAKSQLGEHILLHL